MEQTSNTKSFNVAQKEESKERRVELESKDPNARSDKKPLIEDGAIISNLGWISILSLTISGLSMIGVGAGL
jgi:hypothetical protein